MNISHASLNGFRSQHQHQHKGQLQVKKVFVFLVKYHHVYILLFLDEVFTGISPLILNNQNNFLSFLFRLYLDQCFQEKRKH